jgi:hypothetical protein
VRLYFLKVILHILMYCVERYVYYVWWHGDPGCLSVLSGTVIRAAFFGTLRSAMFYVVGRECDRDAMSFG